MIEPLPYDPDWAIPPGATILELLEDAPMSQDELADRLGMPSVSDLIAGDMPITPTIAEALGNVFMFPTNFWMHLEENYQRVKAKHNGRRPT